MTDKQFEILLSAMAAYSWFFLDALYKKETCVTDPSQQGRNFNQIMLNFKQQFREATEND